MAKKNVTKVRQAATTSVAARYVRATGAPISDEDAQVIGTCLAALAEQNRVSDVRSLSKSTVLAAVEADPDHPMRPYYEWDDAIAARKHRLEHTSVLIRSIRIQAVSVGPLPQLKPMFVSAEVPQLKGPVARRYVLTDDATRSDPVFASAIAQHMKRIIDSLASLELLTRDRSTPALRSFCDSMRSAVDDYRTAMTPAQQAAE